jgi:hypothetical protein
MEGLPGMDRRERNASIVMTVAECIREAERVLGLPVDDEDELDELEGKRWEKVDVNRSDEGGVNGTDASEVKTPDQVEVRRPDELQVNFVSEFREAARGPSTVVQEVNRVQVVRCKTTLKVSKTAEPLEDQTPHPKTSAQLPLKKLLQQEEKRTTQLSSRMMPAAKMAAEDNQVTDGDGDISMTDLPAHVNKNQQVYAMEQQSSNNKSQIDVIITSSDDSLFLSDDLEAHSCAQAAIRKLRVPLPDRRVDTFTSDDNLGHSLSTDKQPNVKSFRHTTSKNPPNLAVKLGRGLVRTKKALGEKSNKNASIMTRLDQSREAAIRASGAGHDGRDVQEVCEEKWFRTVEQKQAYQVENQKRRRLPLLRAFQELEAFEDAAIFAEDGGVSYEAFNIDVDEEVVVEESDDEYVPKAAKRNRTDDLLCKVNRPLLVRQTKSTGAELRELTPARKKSKYERNFNPSTKSARWKMRSRHMRNTAVVPTVTQEIEAQLKTIGLGTSAADEGACLEAGGQECFVSLDKPTTPTPRSYPLSPQGPNSLGKSQKTCITISDDESESSHAQGPSAAPVITLSSDDSEHAPSPPSINSSERRDNAIQATASSPSFAAEPKATNAYLDVLNSIRPNIQMTWIQLLKAGRRGIPQHLQKMTKEQIVLKNVSFTYNGTMQAVPSEPVKIRLPALLISGPVSGKNFSWNADIQLLLEIIDTAVFNHLTQNRISFSGGLGPSRMRKAGTTSLWWSPDSDPRGRLCLRAQRSAHTKTRLLQMVKDASGPPLMEACERCVGNRRLCVVPGPVDDTKEGEERFGSPVVLPLPATLRGNAEPGDISYYVREYLANPRYAESRRKGGYA